MVLTPTEKRMQKMRQIYGRLLKTYVFDCRAVGKSLKGEVTELGTYIVNVPA